MEMAVEQAQRSAAEGGIATGAVLVKNDEIISSGHDLSCQENNPVAMAEMDCIRQAGRRNDQAQLVLYSTGYPNMLVAGTILQFSIGTLVIGLPETSNFAINLLINNDINVQFLPLE